MREPRTAVLILVEALWEDQSGTLRSVPARMEDRSASGACLRVKTPIRVGSRLKIRWRWEQFSGIVRYCRSEGAEYFVGIQRDTTTAPILQKSAPTDAPLPKDVRNSDAPVSPACIQSLANRQEGKPIEVPATGQPVEHAPILRSASHPTATPARTADREIDSDDRPRISQARDFDTLPRTELRTKQPPKEKEAGKERKHMRHKWLELAPWHKQDALSRGGNGYSNGKAVKENRTPQEDPPAEKTRDIVGEGITNLQVELLPMQEVYRAAGISHPQKGYSIAKVVEMLHSEHIRSLSKEMKRAAVLMALDAAGIPLNHLLQDAKARQDALDSYETEQRKQVEGEWARKTEENVQIQAELERIKAHYMSRMNRNLDAVAREKAAFSSWLTMKLQESQSISEAAELCLKSTVSEPATSPLAEVGRTGVSAGAV